MLNHNISSPNLLLTIDIVIVIHIFSKLFLLSCCVMLFVLKNFL
uniref:Uncharacterized protein n=1 Tax=Brassica campestris TaxID=3711 RepID=A0A3P6BF19_BRACM|nr:unnamed protein product [Brassica rapa]